MGHIAQLSTKSHNDIRCMESFTKYPDNVVEYRYK